MNRHITTADVEGHMPRIRWAQDEQSHAPVPTHEAPHHAASLGRRGLRPMFIAALVAALAVSVLSSAADAILIAPNGGVRGDGGNATVGSDRIWATTRKDTGYYVKFRYYVQSLTCRHISGWSNNGGWIEMGQGSRVIGGLANRGSGQVKVYVQYALWNGSGWQYSSEWLFFPNANSWICVV